MLPPVWAHRLVVALLAAGFGWLLPAHHHGLAHGPHAAAADDHDHHELVAAATGHHHHDDDTHDPAEDGDHHAGDEPDRHQDGDHPAGCGVCHAVRTLYTPVAVALPVLAPQAVTAALPPDPDEVVSVRPRPAYHGRAPPAFL